MPHNPQKENSARRDWNDFPLSKRSKFFAGKLLGALFPKLRSKIEEAPFENDSSLRNRLIRNGLYADAFRMHDHRRLRNYLSHYWKEEASSFHENWNDRFERLFLERDICIIEDLAKHQPTFVNLYEIGCGGGQVMQHLHDQFPQFENLTGIDLGEEQILKNQAAYPQERIAFVAADACKWIPENAQSDCVILTNGGVFEYFLQSELEMLFSHAAKKLAPSAICIVETIATDHDLDRELDSLVYGREMAFSHNYPHLLKSAGFKIVSCSERAGDSIDGGGRWIRILAVNQ